MKDIMQEVIKEYYPEYCHSLETIYGKGMMSEGGAEGIDTMFEGVSITGKKALDIGSGLGGVAYYLASEYAMDVTGLEINPWMVSESMRRAPENISKKLRFIQSTDNDSFPLEDESFDIVYSKGALCHVEHKEGLLKECYRVLKPGGALVINDWVSPIKGQWGPNVEKLVELESLSLFAETVDGYVELCENANFSDIEAQNHSSKYAAYNEQIVEELKKTSKKEEFIHSFSEKLYLDAIEGYSSIAKAMREKEGIVLQLKALKK